jgi:hypothetical protein
LFKQLRDHLAGYQYVFSDPGRGIGVLLDLFNLDNAATCAQYTTADTDLVSSCVFVASQNPHSDACVFKTNYALFNIVLQEVFNSSHTKKGEAFFYVFDT